MTTSSLIQTGLDLSSRVIRTAAELRDLGPAWKEFFQRIQCENVFLSYEWLSEWWFHLGQGHKLFVIVLQDDTGRLAALAPLNISVQAGPLHIRRLGFLGDRLVGSDYLDFLLDPDCLGPALDGICRQILKHRREWDYLELADTRLDSVTASQFAENMQRHGMTMHVAPSSICPYALLPETPAAYLARRSSIVQNTIKRNSRSLSREGELEFTTVSNPPQIQVSFADIVRLHQARFRERGCESAFLRPEVETFHRLVLASLSIAGRTRIHLLKLNGRAIAGLYGFSLGGSFYYYQSGFDPAYSRLSVGTLVLCSAIQSAIRTGHSKFDFLRGTEPYKRLWADDYCQLCTVRLFDHRARSLTAKSKHFIYHSLRCCIKAARSSRIRIAQNISRFGARRTLP